MSKNKNKAEALAASVPEAVAEVAAEVEANVAKAPAIGSDEFKALSCEERTQIIAAETYEGAKKFLCSLRDQPSVTIAANSGAEARERYMELCGINHTEHQIGVAPV